jgi:hypothetical protein
MVELEALGKKPGAIGPVSNCVNGAQQVDLGAYQDVAGMMRRADTHHRAHHSCASETPQLRGLFLLIHPDCLSDVGGFDTRFGIGNFEDDDHNLRCRLAGYTLWIADGAFLHHEGSATFKALGIDYSLNIERNLQLMLEKWGLERPEEMHALARVPEGVDVFQPLRASRGSSGFAIEIQGEKVDLVHQASDMEFAAWLVGILRAKPRRARIQVLQALEDLESVERAKAS